MAQVGENHSSWRLGLWAPEICGVVANIRLFGKYQTMPLILEISEID